MKPIRKVTPTELLGLKAATRRVLDRFGKLEDVEQITRVKKPALSKYGAPHEESFIPVDVALDCDRDCGEPVILREMAALEGYDLVARGTAAGRQPQDPAAVSSLVGRLIREVADVSAETLTAVADGTFTRRERAAVLAEIDEAYAALGALRIFVAEGL